MTAITEDDKASFIQYQACKGPVLVYCNNSLLQVLEKLVPNIIIVDEDVDHGLLRALDTPCADGQYHVVIGTTMFAMRGIDYRSATVPMTLFVAKSFNNKRETV